MAIYALINAAGEVVNTIEWDGVTAVSPFAGTTAVAVAGAGVSIGWKSNGRGGFTAPPEPSKPPEPNPTNISALVFFGRFTAPERVAVQTAINASPELGVGLVNGLAAGGVDLVGPAVAAWVGGLVAAGALTKDRAAEILTP